MNTRVLLALSLAIVATVGADAQVADPLAGSPAYRRLFLDAITLTGIKA